MCQPGRLKRFFDRIPHREREEEKDSRPVVTHTQRFSFSFFFRDLTSIGDSPTHEIIRSSKRALRCYARVTREEKSVQFSRSRSRAAEGEKGRDGIESDDI